MDQFGEQGKKYCYLGQSHAWDDEYVVRILYIMVQDCVPQQTNNKLQKKNGFSNSNLSQGALSESNTVKISSTLHLFLPTLQNGSSMVNLSQLAQMEKKN